MQCEKLQTCELTSSTGWQSQADKYGLRPVSELDVSGWEVRTASSEQIQMASEKLAKVTVNDLDCSGQQPRM